MVLSPTNSEINNIISEQIHSQRDRAILRRVLVDGISYERVAEECDISRNTVYNVVRRSRHHFN